MVLRRNGGRTTQANFQRSLLYSIGVAILLFFGLQFGLFYRDFLTLDEQKSALEMEIRNKERLLDSQKMKIIEKERSIFRLEQKLRDYESKIRLPSYGGGKNESKTDLGLLRTIYIITPTYARPTQKADLTRLSHTLSLVSNIYWIVVEDSATGRSDLVENVLKRSKIRYALVYTATPPNKKLNDTQPPWLKPKGVLQRNEALKWLRTNLHINADGVVYFADDDNTYDLRLFEEMRTIRTVGVWPVGLSGGLMVERPLVNGSHVIGWKVSWKPKRPYALDMAGFAINLKLLLHKKDARFTYNVSRGYQETHILSQLIGGLDELEPKANLCTEVYVWHTRTEPVRLDNEKRLKAIGMASDDGIEV